MQWGDQEEQQPRYICAGCGERYVEKNPPCQKCASEQFARFEDGDRIPDRVKDVANVQWRCTSCGEMHPRNSPPCNVCGGMQYRTAADDFSTEGEVASESEPDGGGVRRVTGPKIVAYLFGIQAIMLSIGYLTTAVVGAILFSISGALALPPVRRSLRVERQIDLSTGAVVLLCCGMYLFAWILLVARI